MLKLNYKINNTNATIKNTYAWIANANVNSDRTQVSGYVQFSTNSQDWQMFEQKEFLNLPYDVNSSDNAVKQMYTHLKTLPEFEGATDYPAVE